MKKYRLLGFSLLITMLLVGCGGSSSGNDTTQTQNESTQTGVIVDSQIIGLRYISTNKDKTQTKKGITTSKGEFEYFEDGTTEFFVGNIKIGDTTPSKMVAITTIAKTEKESENIARFLQTIDEDSNPDNGIQISSSVDEHARRDTVSLKFDDSFDTDFDSVKVELFKHTANIPATISVEQALNHSSKSERLSSINEFDLYKAIANEKNYRGGDYYNADVLENDQRKRVYLWLWEKLLSKEMAIEDELQFSKPEFDINNVEETRNEIKKYLDYAESVVSVGSLASGTMENLSKAGSRTMSYNISKLTSLTVGGCEATVKLYDANTEDTQELSDDNLCKNIMKVVNPVGDSTSKLAIANPILSGFLPELLPKLIHAKKMNWLHFNTKSLRTISKMKVSKPDVVSIALSIAQISNDFYGASWASSINEELTTRMVAREWLNIWFRSGFKQDYMNKLINNNTTKLSGSVEQIEAIALKLGSTGALCDTYKFFNPFYECTGIENINYNYDKVRDIVNEKLSKSNALYRNITDLTGSFSNEKAEIGVIEIDWIEEGNVSDYNSSIDKASVDLCSVTKDNKGLAHALFNISTSETLDNPGHVTYEYLGSPYNHSGLDVHAGTDFRSKDATNAGLHTVYSVVSGKVVKAENGTGFGQVGVQRIDDNNQTILFSYAHLNSTSLKVGDTVEVGDIIGKTGKKGTASPHLHIEYRTNYTGTSLIGGASCGGTCSESEVTSKTNNPVDIINLECGNNKDDSQFLNSNQSIATSEDNVTFTYNYNGTNCRIDFRDGTKTNLNSCTGIINHKFNKEWLYGVQLYSNDELIDTSTITIENINNDWIGYVSSLNSYKEDNENSNDIIKDGRLFLSSSLTTKSYYWTHYRYVKPSILNSVSGDNFILEARIKAPSSEGGISCYDPSLGIIGESAKSAWVTFMSPGCTYYSSIGAVDSYDSGGASSKVPASDLSILGQDFSDWKTIKLEVKNNNVSAYYEDEKLYTKEYTGNVGNIFGIRQSFKGSGSIDWIKLYNGDGTLIYNEEFN